MKITIITILFPLLIFSFSFTGSRSIHKIKKKSETIVIGQLESKKPMFTSNNSIRTSYLFNIIKSFKGTYRVNDNLKIVLLGGQIGDFVTNIPGSSNFKLDHKYILFLNKSDILIEQIDITLEYFDYTENKHYKAKEIINILEVE